MCSSIAIFTFTIMSYIVAFNFYVVQLWRGLCSDFVLLLEGFLKVLSFKFAHEMLFHLSCNLRYALNIVLWKYLNYSSYVFLTIESKLYILQIPHLFQFALRQFRSILFHYIAFSVTFPLNLCKNL